MKLRPIWSRLFLGFFILFFFAMPNKAFAQVNVGISVQIAPPVLPIYRQPPLPAPGYLWLPGYWAYDPYGGYFWVPGTWVQPPRVGYLWTPGYWGWINGAYLWNGGYWGPHVGFYGGINYGFGYGGFGYAGGRWNNGVFAYNRAANNFGGVHVTAVFNTPLVVQSSARVAFNGGPDGVAVRPTAAEQLAGNDPHIAATSAQTQHIAAAQSNHSLFASQNHGAPPIAATSRAGAFTGPGVVAARGAPQGPATHAAGRGPKPANHANAAVHHPATPRSPPDHEDEHR